MRVFDPKRAIDQRAAIRAAIFYHAEVVATGTVSTEALDLSQFGIRLDAADLTLERSQKWTKRKPTEYREEIVVLAGLWRSIDVRLRNKARYPKK